MSKNSAALTPMGRQRIASLIVDQGWPVRRAAERFQCSPATASKWAARYRAGESLEDRSSRPRTSPMRIPRRLERRIIGLRVTRQWGPHQIGYHLGIARSTVGRVLARYRMPLLAHLDRTTGVRVRAPRPIRYEKSTAGALVHVDIKKLGKVPDGGGWRTHGRGSVADRNSARGRHRATRRGESSSRGYVYLHHAVDDYSRLVYSEILPDETRETARDFWRRANAFFAEQNITVKAVMTDNGACYRSHMFAAALTTKIEHWRTRPYRPQTNGKVERFNRTLADEWAYARNYTSEQHRASTYNDWIHHYNHHRPHTALKGQTPAQRVHDLTGNYS